MPRFLPRFRSALVLAVLASLPASGAQALGYRLELLAPLEEGGHSKAEDLNDAGVVVGEAWGDSGYRPARWLSPAQGESLGALDPDDPYEYGYATAVNASGAIVGAAPGSSGTRPFRWSEAGGLQDLGHLGGAYPAGEAKDVNDLGQIAVSYGGRAWVVEPDGSAIDLGSLTPGSDSSAFAITNAGLVAGTWWDWLGGGFGAFAWTATGGIQELGSLGPGGGTTPFAANEQGQVVGMSAYASGDGQRRAFLWSAAAGMVDLGTGGFQESLAWDVNEQGQAVGVALTVGVRAVATLWDPVLGFVDLNDVVVNRDGFELDEAVAINDRGQIAANAIVDGYRRGVLLTPVPEPATALLVAVGIASLARRRSS